MLCNSGAALSLVLTNYIQPIVLIIYARLSKIHKKTWGGTIRLSVLNYNYAVVYIGWSWECLEDWGQYFKLGLPGVAIICIEWISFEVSAFILGTIGEIELAINAVLINTLTYLFMVCYSLYCNVVSVYYRYL